MHSVATAVEWYARGVVPEGRIEVFKTRFLTMLAANSMEASHLPQRDGGIQGRLRTLQYFS